MKTILCYLLAGQALAMASSSNFQLFQRSNVIDSPPDDLVNFIVEMPQRRQLSTSTLTEDEFMKMKSKEATQWDTVTENTCMESMKMKNKVSNPSGMTICYNIPFLDAKTGVFEADLRVYMVSPTTGPFQTITTDKIQIGISFAQAAVSPLNRSSLTRRMSDGTTLLPLSRSVNTPTMKRETKPTLIRRYDFVGQINKAILPSTPEALKPILVPNVTLSAVDSTGATITTSPSSDEIDFVTGTFAATRKSTPTKALLEPPIQTLVVAPDAPFVVPGLGLLIFPVGLVITGIWTVLIVGTIGYGTFERIQWRERFREAKLRESRGPVKSI